MVQVAVTLQVRGREVSVDQLQDRSVAETLRKLGSEVGEKMDGITCPEHSRGAKKVRLHVNESGNADIRYDACCDKLRALIGKALG
jgi:hypothetical protein